MYRFGILYMYHYRFTWIPYRYGDFFYENRYLLVETSAGTCSSITNFQIVLEQVREYCDIVLN
jgi:hypothetical protein